MLRKLTTCKHFTGVHNQSCAIGKSYFSVARDTKNGRVYPCQDYNCTSCRWRRYPSEDEARRLVTEEQAGITRAIEAFSAIMRECRGVRSGGKTIWCPNCNRLSLVYRFTENGSLRARCGTQGCCSLME